MLFIKLKKLNIKTLVCVFFLFSTVCLLFAQPSKKNQRKSEELIDLMDAMLDDFLNPKSYDREPDWEYTAPVFPSAGVQIEMDPAESLEPRYVSNKLPQTAEPSVPEHVQFEEEFLPPSVEPKNTSNSTVAATPKSNVNSTKQKGKLGLREEYVPYDEEDDFEEELPAPSKTKQSNVKSNAKQKGKLALNEEYVPYDGEDDYDDERIETASTKNSSKTNSKSSKPKTKIISSKEPDDDYDDEPYVPVTKNSGKKKTSKSSYVEPESLEEEFVEDDTESDVVTIVKNEPIEPDEDVKPIEEEKQDASKGDFNLDDFDIDNDEEAVLESAPEPAFEKARAITFAPEYNSYNSSFKTIGANASMEFTIKHNVTIGFIGGGYYNLNKNNKVFELEVAFFFRYYLMSKAQKEAHPYPFGFFLQSEVGAAVALNSKGLVTDQLGLKPSPLIALKAGYRKYIGGTHVYIEPYVRVGYPFVAGAGIGFGVRL